MKKTFRISAILFFAVLMLFTSCNDKLMKMDDGSINEYIYPYIKFEPTEDGNSVTAVVVAGAQLNTVKIPATVDGVKVNEFIGFENPEDAKSVTEIVFGSHETVITDDALEQAINLEQVKVDSNSYFDKWGKLPLLEKEGYEFLGWYVGEDKVYEGMLMDPNNSNAVPKWRAHKYIEHDGKAPTCTESGWMPYKTCETCDYNDRIMLPALGHDLSYVEYKPAECDEPGNREYWKCNRCGLMFSDAGGKNVIDEVVLPAFGHDLSNVPEVPAKCDSFGTKVHWECERCGSRFFDEAGERPVAEDSDLMIPMLPHTPSSDWSSDETHHWHFCFECGNQIDYSAHTWNEGEVIVQPEADKPGKIKYTCTVCSHTREEVMKPDADHVFEEYMRKDATCTEDGYVIMKCSKCGLTYTESIPKKNHSAKKAVEAVEPSCTEPGNIKYWYCKDCEKYFKDAGCSIGITREETVIEPLGHDWKSVYESDETGHWHECTRCDAISGKTEHTFNLENHENILALKSSATCTSPAVYYRSCICGVADKDPENTFEYGKSLELIHHPATDKPCAEDGHIEYWECAKCGKKFSDAEGNKEITEIRAGHKPSSTYFRDDDNHYLKCSVCDEILSQGAHDSKAWGADDEWHWRICSVCGYEVGVKEKHVWEKRGEDYYCKICNSKSPEKIEGEGGFDIEVIVTTPKGHLSMTDMENGKISFVFVDDNPKYPPTSYVWTVNGIGQEVEGKEFVLDVTECFTYQVKCLVRNEGGVFSDSVMVDGETILSEK